MDIDGPCTCDIDGEDGVGGQAEVVEEGAEVHLGQAGGQHLHRHHHLTHNCWNKYQLSGGAVLGSWIRNSFPGSGIICSGSGSGRIQNSFKDLEVFKYKNLFLILGLWFLDCIVLYR